MAYPALSIVMPCHNRAYDLARVLDSYEEQSGEGTFELIAVDDASQDETYDLLKSYNPTRFTIRVERLYVNQGPAAARNKGISLARAPLILFVGDDIVPDRNLVRGHIAAHRRYRENNDAVLGYVAWPDSMPVNTLMRHIDGMGAEQFSYYYLKDGEAYDFRHFYTANISIKKEFLYRLDRWFDTDFPYAAFEDVELAYRLSKNGLRIVYSSHLSGEHYHYHNIWTFSNRQYRSGLMACVLAKKHPETAKIVVGRSFWLRSAYWRALAAAGRYPSSDTDWLESETLHLLSAYEWKKNPLIDQLYLRVLNYYYQKGLIYGNFGETPLARRIHDVFARRALIPGLSWFFNESERIQGWVPEDQGPWILNRFSTSNNSLT